MSQREHDALETFRENLEYADMADKIWPDNPERAQSIRNYALGMIEVHAWATRALDAADAAVAALLRRGGRPRTELTEDTLAAAWRHEYDPKLGRARLEDVVEYLGFDDSGWFRELYQRLHPDVLWPNYRPEFYLGCVTVNRQDGEGE
jgi:hypothetical protein